MMDGLKERWLLNWDPNPLDGSTWIREMLASDKQILDNNQASEEAKLFSREHNRRPDRLVSETNISGTLKSLKRLRDPVRSLPERTSYLWHCCIPSKISGFNWTVIW